jgi:OsmC-like protein
VEYLLGALGADLAQGLQVRASRVGIRVENLELQLSGRLDNIFVYLGAESSGHSGFSRISGTAHVRADADEATLQALWREVLAASPLLQTLSRPVETEINLQSFR